MKTLVNGEIADAKDLNNNFNEMQAKIDFFSDSVASMRKSVDAANLAATNAERQVNNCTSITTSVNSRLNNMENVVRNILHANKSELAPAGTSTPNGYITKTASKLVDVNLTVYDGKNGYAPKDWRHVCTIPAGYTPSAEVYGICASAKVSGLAKIDTTGKVYINTAEPIPAGWSVNLVFPSYLAN